MGTGLWDCPFCLLFPHPAPRLPPAMPGEPRALELCNRGNVGTPDRQDFPNKGGFVCPSAAAASSCRDGVGMAVPQPAPPAGRQSSCSEPNSGKRWPRAGVGQLNYGNKLKEKVSITKDKNFQMRFLAASLNLM